jgi:hypothetical protein
MTFFTFVFTSQTYDFHPLHLRSSGRKLPRSSARAMRRHLPAGEDGQERLPSDRWPTTPQAKSRSHPTSSPQRRSRIQLEHAGPDQAVRLYLRAWRRSAPRPPQQQVVENGEEQRLRPRGRLLLRPCFTVGCHTLPVRDLCQLLRASPPGASRRGGSRAGSSRGTGLAEYGSQSCPRLSARRLRTLQKGD